MAENKSWFSVILDVFLLIISKIRGDKKQEAVIEQQKQDDQKKENEKINNDLNNQYNSNIEDSHKNENNTNGNSGNNNTNNNKDPEITVIKDELNDKFK